MGAAIDLSGQRFGRLTVTGPAERGGDGGKRWICRCDCGTATTVRAANLTQGYSKSCGCLARESKLARFTTHNMTGTPEFVIWKGMHSRCRDMGNSGYALYGGRGITVCERWSKFENFYADMGQRPDGMTIEREESNGNYEPSNCRWATPTEQANNTSRNKMIAVGDRIMTMAMWSREPGAAAYGAIQARLLRGWPAERAVFGASVLPFKKYAPAKVEGEQPQSA